MAWQVQEAKARFSEMLETSQVEGPQIVTKRGVETAVLVAMHQWREIQRRVRPGIKEWLLVPEVRTESLTPPRVGHRHRPLPKLD